jgi:hypothetical protein
MKLCRYGPAGQEKPGLIDADGAIRDLSGVVADHPPIEISPEGLAKLAAIDPATLPLVEGKPALWRARGRHGKFVAIGLNYADHAPNRTCRSRPSRWCS